MDTAVVLGQVLGAVFVLVGISVLNKRTATSLIAGLDNSPALLWIAGVITFLAGAVSLSIYAVWSSDLRVLITIIGWLLVIKGALITLFPVSMMSFYRKFENSPMMFFAGIVAIILGGVLFMTL